MKNLPSSITTEHMRISGVICQNLDKAVYQNGETSLDVYNKSQAYRTELVNFIAKHDPAYAEKIKNNGLYYIFSAALNFVK